MSQNPGGHEFTPIDPLAQNIQLRKAISLLPRRSAEEDTAALPFDASFRRMLLKESNDGDYPVLREQFVTRLAESYATPSLQEYALLCFDDVYVIGRRNDATAPLSEYNRSNRSEIALLTLTASDNLTSPGLYDPQTAKGIEQTLYRHFALPSFQTVWHLVDRELTTPTPPDKLTPNLEYLQQMARQFEPGYSISAQITRLLSYTDRLVKLWVLTEAWLGEFYERYGEEITPAETDTPPPDTP